MALSAVEYIYNGTDNEFLLNFPLGYTSRDEIHAFVNDLVDGLGNPVEANITFLDDNRIRVDDPLVAGDTVLIRRIAEKEELEVEFDAGADVTPRNLDAAARQGLSIYQEILDGYVPVDPNSMRLNDAGTGWVGRTLPIKDVGTPVDDNDAAPRRWVLDAIRFAPENAADGVLSIDEFIGDGSTAEYTLSATPSSKRGVTPYVDGLIASRDSFSLSGRTVTFTENVPSGVPVQIFVASAAQAVVGGTEGSVYAAINTFTGDGSTVDFTMSITPEDANGVFAMVGGVVQARASFSVSGDTLTFSEAPAVGEPVELYVTAPTDITIVASDRIEYNTVADLLASSTMYSEGTYIHVIEGDFTYKAAASGDVTNAGGQQFDLVFRSDFVSTGTGANIVVPDTSGLLSSGAWFTVLMNENSDEGMTLNGTAVKILDVYNTEQNQWTITDGGNASKDQPKVNVYRKVYRNMLSEDVAYRFRYLEAEGFYEVQVHHIYKHMFVGTGNGAEIAELQDVFGFISQFTLGTAMDPIFMRSDADTEYYPNKAQISITLPCGTVESPVTSTFTKQVRLGEANLAGVEIINETRYETNLPAEACIAEYTGTLGADDLAFLNIWKTDLGEIKKIRWKYAGVFDQDNQSVIRYNRSYARLKDCEIDVSEATFSGSPAAVSAVYWDGENECFSNTVLCNATTEQDLAAFAVGPVPSVSPGLSVKGRAKHAYRVRGILTVSNAQVTDPVTNLVDAFGPCHLSFTGGSTDLSGCTNVGNYNSNPTTLSVASGLTTFAALAPYVGSTYTFGDKVGISSAVTPQFVVDHPTGGARLAFGVAGVTSTGGIGHYASTSGLELSGNNATRHMKVTSGGSIEAGSDNLYNMGTQAKRWANVYGKNIRPGDGSCTWTSGAGTPEGNLSAPVGSLYTRTDGGASTTLYVKESGTGSTGWIAK